MLGEIFKMTNDQLKILIYNDELLCYKTGNLVSTREESSVIDIGDPRDINKRILKSPLETMTFVVDSSKQSETVKLDDTLMRRIAKYNKEIEVKELDKNLKDKEEKIKELEEKIEDREKRWKKIQEFVANIYDLPVEDDEDDYYNEDY